MAVSDEHKNDVLLRLMRARSGTKAEVGFGCECMGLFPGELLGICRIWNWRCSLQRCCDAINRL